MRAKWLIGIGLSVFLAAPFVVAQEPEGDAALKQEQKREQKQDQQKIQEQVKKQEKLQAQEQNRNRNRHRKNNAPGDVNAAGGGGAEGASGSSEPTVNPADDTQLVDQDGDGIDDQVQSQNQGEKGDGEKGAMKRGQHRYRHRKAVGTAAQQGEGTQKRAGKGFGEGFVDSDGNGVCDNYSNRKGK